jgi:hypothetical protein
MSPILFRVEGRVSIIDKGVRGVHARMVLLARGRGSSFHARRKNSSFPHQALDPELITIPLKPRTCPGRDARKTILSRGAETACRGWKVPTWFKQGHPGG